MSTDPPSDVVRQVLELDELLRSALHERDLETLERYYAAGFTLNGPAGRIQSREETLERLRESSMQQTDVERVIEAAFSVGEVVVIMGRESLVWEGTGSELDGKRTARRFTNVWHRIDGEWRYVARQATTVPLDA